MKQILKCVCSNCTTIALYPPKMYKKNLGENAEGPNFLSANMPQRCNKECQYPDKDIWRLLQLIGVFLHSIYLFTL